MSLDLLGSDVVGAQDIAKLQRQMNALKDVPVCVARVLLRKGQEAIDAAIREAKGGIFKSSLPGDTSREKVKGALKWHEENLAKFTDPTAEYPNKEDLKKYVLMAYIEWDASETGRNYNNAIMSWGQLWIDIKSEAAALPKKLKESIEEASDFASGLIPWWIKVGAVVVVGGTAYAVFKIAKAAAPVAAGVAVARYMPPGPYGR